MAVITPNKKEIMQISKIVVSCKIVVTPKIKAKTIMVLSDKIRIFRLEKLSIITPANKEKSNTGNMLNAETTPNQKGELVNCNTNHPWATVCSQVPTNETS